MMLLARYFFQWILAFSNQTSTTPNGTQVTLFAASAVGAVLLLMRIFDAVTDPLAGMLSDVWVEKGRERRQLLVFSLLLPALGITLCFFPAFEMAPLARWSFLVCGMIIFFVGYTFYGIPYWSLVDDYALGDSDTRRVLSSLLGTGLMLATAVGFVISPLLVDQYGYSTTALIFAAVALVLMLLPYFAQPPSLPKSQTHPSQAKWTKGAFIEALRHKRFVSVVMIFVGTQMALTIMTAASPFIATRLLAGSPKDVAFLMGPLLLLSLPCFMLVPRISRRFGWERSIFWAGLALGLVFFSTAFLGKTLIGSPLLTAALCFSLAGPFVAVLIGLEGEVVAICARESEAKSVGTYFGVFNLIVKTMNGFAIFLSAVLVELSLGSLGETAIRIMVLCSGLSILAGLALYGIFRQRSEN